MTFEKIEQYQSQQKQIDSLQRIINNSEFIHDFEFEEFFVYDEFDSKDNSPNYKGEKIKSCLEEKLAVFNMITKENHVVNSGLRSHRHNSSVGGSQNSAHISGHAVDIKCKTDEQRYTYIVAALQAGFDRIGIHPSFVHLDCKGDNDTRIWLYKK